MASFWFWSALFTSLLLVVQPRLGVGSRDTYWDFKCSSGNFTPGDSYETFLKSAVSTLPEKVSSSAPLFFANDTIGSQTKDQLYAVASCRGDSSNATVCKSCVIDALQEAPIVCPFKRGATILYEGCTVAYSDKGFKMFSINSTSSNDIALLKYNKSRAAIESDVLQKGAASLIDAVIDKAAELSPVHFATGSKVLDTDGHKVEGLPSALDSFQEILKLAASKEIVLFLDYDGTLSPIVSDPDKAYMPGQVKQ
ncbi:unnamed protein product [Urochloa decumbens]|uniref:Gnk2-homologous domain-containing protein n=1 Tax=Urochloa decumbens TaxID=240449 RepID=A0ABC8W7P6_9POAL